MSGHSKWSQIKRQKGVSDMKRAVIFTKLASAIALAAKMGGGSDPQTNFRLRLAVDKAKAVNMPKENIQRAIQRGSGELDGEQFEEVMYEGFGPGKIAVMAHVITNNRNRTASVMKHVFSEYHGSLGLPRSVAWMFDHYGVIVIAHDQLSSARKEQVEFLAIEQGAIDIRFDAREIWIYMDPSILQKMKDALEEKSFSIESAEIEYVPKDQVKIMDEAVKKEAEQFLEALEDTEDVTGYFTNFESDETPL